MPKKIKSIPEHVGIIMDGNRRWARKRGLPTLEGHRRGLNTAIKLVEYAFDSGVKYLTLYAFSTQNWNRSQKEVSYLMKLLLKMIEDQAQRLHKRGIQIRVIGTRKRLSDKVLKAIDKAESLTKNNKKGTLLIAFNYESREEIIHAVKAIMKNKYSSDRVTEIVISNHLYTAGIPDPDLIIRTSGEHRLSGFLLWQAAHSELYFTKVLWPAFSDKDFDLALADYAKRKRRFGK